MTNNKIGKGYLHVYTGDGKGKTTAALGLALRAAGAGLHVLFVQFVKGKRYSEIRTLEKFPDQIVIKQVGRGCFIKQKPDKADIDAAREGLQYVREQMNEGGYQLIILDEACIALHFGLFSEKDLLALLAERGEGCEAVVTGRNAPQKLVDAADLVTEMKEIKHYYTKGVQAREGIES